MLDIISMWRHPKMIAYFATTTALYAVLLYPVSQFSLFGLQADYLRIAMFIPASFAFLFGPAAAWGTAVGNLIFDAASGNGLTLASAFGFVGNFLIAYIPYMLWSKVTSDQPDMRSIKKLALFMALIGASCTICGLIIGWALLYLFQLPFVMTTFTIIGSDTLWAILLGPVVLAASYRYLNKRKLLYLDIMQITPKPSLSKKRVLAIGVFVASAALCFVIPAYLNVDATVLLPFVASAFIALIAACK
ncbi:QueT transporter family protein [Candidatus Bathyarchaeota archaeon]|nr:QueT transporter family protein [Candidatus Bathyarchaeota archaeon]